MHAFLTTALCTTNNQYTILAAHNNTNSDASPVCSRTSSPPLLSPIFKASMHTATNDGAEWVSQGIYTLLVAVSHVEMDICMASPGPDSLMLRGSVEPAQTLLKGHLMLQDNYGLYTDIESIC